MKYPIACILLTTSLLMACGSPDPRPGRTPQEQLLGCPNPRPQACTMDYNPVCGVVGDKMQTFANGCTACSESKVKGYYLRPCPEPGGAAPTEAAVEDEPGDDPGG